MNHPLASQNLGKEDITALVRHFSTSDHFTQGEEVRAFEREFASWLGGGEAVYVNSGSSANLLTFLALREKHGAGEVLLSALNWPSPIVSAHFAGYRPRLVDCSLRHFGSELGELKARLTPATKVVWLTHVLGFPSLTPETLAWLRKTGVTVVEDCSQALGARLGDRKLGTFASVANFSFYYSHQLSTIEGGMIVTSDPELAEIMRMMRAHGRSREMRSREARKAVAERFSDLHEEMLFLYPGFNVKGTDLGALIGRRQLRTIDTGLAKRNANLRLFLSELDPATYETGFALEGASSFALPVVLKQPQPGQIDVIAGTLRAEGIEFRRGICGGGNQIRQPYARRLGLTDSVTGFPNTDRLHFNSLYVGNYAELSAPRVRELCRVLNELSGQVYCAYNPGETIVPSNKGGVPCRNEF